MTSSRKKTAGRPTAHIPNWHRLEVPVPEGRAGLVVIGGLNPLAAAWEAGIDTHNKALTGLFEFEQLVEFSRLDAQVNAPPEARS